MKQKITHELIAQRCGVSRVAVSQVLNNSRSARIGEEKRREILSLAQSMGYQPRNLTTHTIGYVASFETRPDLDITYDMARAAAHYGYRLALFGWEDDENAMRRALNAKTVDAAIFSRWHGGAIRSILPPEIPWLVIADEDDVDETADLMVVDAAQATRVLMEELLATGHRRFCLVSGIAGAFHDRVKHSFSQSLKNAGLPRTSARIIEVIHAHEIAAPLQKALNAAHPPDAIVTLEAVRALATVNLLQSRGISIPQQISVVSLFSNHHFDWLRPRMTTTTMGREMLTHRFIERLLQRLADPALPPNHTKLQGEIVRGASVARKKR